MSKNRDRAKPRSQEQHQADLRARGYIFRPTPDDWAPTFADGTVAVSNVMPLSNGKFRIAVWGGDDLGMELDLDTAQEARRQLASLPSIITLDDLQARGFIRA